MSVPLMPKATAVWLFENTTLTFDQIAEFCGMHALEVQAIADGEVAIGMVGSDPIASNQLTKLEIARCEQDPTARLQMAQSDIPQPVLRSKGPRYTPVTKRAEKPDAILWLLRNHPELSDAQVCKLIGTTKPTVNSVRERTHWNTPNIKPQSPVLLGICKYADLEEALQKARKRQGLPETPPEAAAPLDGAEAEAPVADDAQEPKPAPTPEHTAESLFRTPGPASE